MASPQTQDVELMLAYCWSTVYDAGPTLNKYWFNVLCLLGMLSAITVCVMKTSFWHIFHKSSSKASILFLFLHTSMSVCFSCDVNHSHSRVNKTIWFATLVFVVIICKLRKATKYNMPNPRYLIAQVSPWLLYAHYVGISLIICYSVIFLCFIYYIHIKNRAENTVLTVTSRPQKRL